MPQPKTVDSSDVDQKETDQPTVESLQKEIAEIRKSVGQGTPAAVPVNTAHTPEELHAARIEEVSKYEFYCPGCGALSSYIKDCVGRPEAPHPPIEMVSTEELLQDDPSKHTPAPNTENLG